jgi:hypothetical protein
MVMRATMVKGAVITATAGTDLGHRVVDQVDLTLPSRVDEGN